MAAGDLLKDSYRVGVAVVRVLGDSTKTYELHRVEEIAYCQIVEDQGTEPDYDALVAAAKRAAGA